MERKKFLMDTILAALLLFSPFSEVLAQGVNIYDMEWMLKARVRDGKLYGLDMKLEGYIKDGRIYDSNWTPKGYIEGDIVFDLNRNKQGYIKKGDGGVSVEEGRKDSP
jgi:hypothetical protein